MTVLYILRYNDIYQLSNRHVVRIKDFYIDDDDAQDYTNGTNKSETF